jgi:hypothetical protein
MRENEMKKIALLLIICASITNVFAARCVRTAVCTNDGQTADYICRGTLSHSMWALKTQKSNDGISGQCGENSSLQYVTQRGNTLKSGCETYEIDTCEYEVPY